MSWYDWVPQVASDIYGAITKTNANNQAAQTATAATQQATQQELEGLTAAQGSYAASRANDAALQEQAAPGVGQQQLAIAQQNTLTPAQQLALTEARRQSINALNSSDLRGSGRATVATVKNVDDNLSASLMAQNRARADAAAGTLSNQYFTTGRDINTQNQLTGAAQIQSGKVAGAGTQDIGAIQSGQTLNNAALDTGTAASVGDAVSGKAINDVNSAVNQYNKYRSSYGPNAVGGGGTTQNQRPTLGGQ